jgi:hypothetical protein
MHKIFVTAFPLDDGKYMGFALAEDGDGLASQICLNKVWVRHAMGVNSRWFRQKYREKYPDGYHVIDLVDASDKQLNKNKDYMAALELNAETPVDPLTLTSGGRTAD